MFQASDPNSSAPELYDQTRLRIRLSDRVPLLVTIDNAERVVKTRGWGDISEDDLAGIRDELINGGAAALKFARLCDLSEATSVALSNEVLAQWASDPIGSPRVRHAVVCTGPAVMERVLQYISQARRHLHEVSVFPTCEAAFAWVRGRDTQHLL
jgi:hypothetical protein